MRKTKASYFLSSLFSHVLPENFRRKGHRSLCYHSIESVPEWDPQELFTIKRKDFIDHLDYLDHSDLYQVVPFGEGLNEKNSLSLTFDDGYETMFSQVAPECFKRNLPFTVFMVSECLGKKGFLTKQQLRELSDHNLVQIGAHGKTHHSLVSLPPEQLSDELVESKKMLEDTTGKEVNLFSYPYGQFNKEVELQVREAGYKYAGTSFLSLNHSEQFPLKLNRTPLMVFDQLKQFKEKLQGFWDWYYFLQKVRGV